MASTSAVEGSPSSNRPLTSTPGPSEASCPPSQRAGGSAAAVAAILAIGALAWAAWRGQPLPRTRIDLAILALLVAYGVATLSAWNIGLSAPALAGIVATTLMLPVALFFAREKAHVPDVARVVTAARETLAF